MRILVCEGCDVRVAAAKDCDAHLTLLNIYLIDKIAYQCRSGQEICGHREAFSGFGKSPVSKTPTHPFVSDFPANTHQDWPVNSSCNGLNEGVVNTIFGRDGLFSNGVFRNEVCESA